MTGDWTGTSPTRLAATWLLLAGAWLAARAAVAFLCARPPRADLLLHAVVVPLCQLAVLEGLRAARRGMR